MKNPFYRKISFTLLVVTIMQLGQQITIPQLDESMQRNLVHSNPFIRVFTTATGAQYTNPTIFSIGMGPYMMSLILFSALMALGVSKNWSNKVRNGVVKGLIITFAFLQSTQMIISLGRSALRHGEDPGSTFVQVSAVVVLVAGTMLVTWLADMNTAYGIGGLGIMIIPGIITSTFQYLNGQTGEVKLPMTTTNIVILVVVTIAFVAVTEYLNHAEERIPIEQVMTDNQLTKAYFPLKVLIAGAMPLMFGRIVLRLVQLLINKINHPQLSAILGPWFDNRSPQGILMYAVILVSLGYLFAFMNIMPNQKAEELQKSGDYFWDVLPGMDTENFIKYKIHRMTFLSNIYSLCICCIPLLIGLKYPTFSVFSFYFINIYMMITVLDNIIEQVHALYEINHYRLV